MEASSPRTPSAESGDDLWAGYTSPVLSDSHSAESEDKAQLPFKRGPPTSPQRRYTTRNKARRVAEVSRSRARGGTNQVSSSSLPSDTLITPHTSGFSTSHNRKRKHRASQSGDDDPSYSAPPARRQRHDETASRDPASNIASPPLPARIVIHHTDGQTVKCRHTCSSREDCKPQEGWKLGSALGHEQAIRKHPCCSAEHCPAYSLLKRRDRPDKRGREYQEKRRARKRLIPSPLPSLSSNTSVPSTTASVSNPLASGSTASASANEIPTATAPVYPSRDRHVILYVTDPSFHYGSYKEAKDDSAYHYTIFDHEQLKNDHMVRSLHQVLFKGRAVEKDAGKYPKEAGVVCYLYNYVSHMQPMLLSIDLLS